MTTRLRRRTRIQIQTPSAIQTRVPIPCRIQTRVPIPCRIQIRIRPLTRTKARILICRIRRTNRGTLMNRMTLFPRETLPSWRCIWHCWRRSSHRDSGPEGQEERLKKALNQRGNQTGGTHTVPPALGPQSWEIGIETTSTLDNGQKIPYNKLRCFAGPWCPGREAAIRV